MAHQLGIGPINDADEPLQPRLQQPTAKRLMPAEVEQEARNACVMAEPLVAIAMRRPHALDLHVAAPIRGSGHCADMRPETDQRRLIAEALAAKLTDVE